MKKTEKLAYMMKNKNVKCWNDVSEYIRQFKKYDSWTLRDIDKVCHLLFGANSILNK